MSTLNDRERIEYAEYCENIKNSHEPVIFRARAGEAVLYDRRLLHGAIAPKIKGLTRRSFASFCCPEEGCYYADVETGSLKDIVPSSSQAFNYYDSLNRAGFSFKGLVEYD